jgi:hypothetical protein
MAGNIFLRIYPYYLNLIQGRPKTSLQGSRVPVLPPKTGFFRVFGPYPVQAEPEAPVSRPLGKAPPGRRNT